MLSLHFGQFTVLLASSKVNGLLLMQCVACSWLQVPLCKVHMKQDLLHSGMSTQGSLACILDNGTYHRQFDLSILAVYAAPCR